MNIKPPIENKIYASIIGACELLENKSIGNGHHLAQRLTELVSIGLLPKEQKKIYDILTYDPQTTTEIADKLGMSTKIVSTQLAQMNRKTLLIYTGIISKKRYWYKRTVINN
jgi:DNA-binding CsgD family transcriptional regulator